MSVECNRRKIWEDSYGGRLLGERMMALAQDRVEW